MEEYNPRKQFRINSNLLTILNEYCNKYNVKTDIVVNAGIIQDLSLYDFYLAENGINKYYPEYLTIPLDLQPFVPSSENITNSPILYVNILENYYHEIKKHLLERKRCYKITLSLNLYINFCIAREVALEKDYFVYRFKHDYTYKTISCHFARLEIDRLKFYDSGLEIPNYYYDKITGLRTHKPRRNSLRWRKETDKNFDRTA